MYHRHPQRHAACPHSRETLAKKPAPAPAVGKSALRRRSSDEKLLFTRQIDVPAIRKPHDLGFTRSSILAEAIMATSFLGEAINRSALPIPQARPAPQQPLPQVCPTSYRRTSRILRGRIRNRRSPFPPFPGQAFGTSKDQCIQDDEDRNTMHRLGIRVFPIRSRKPNGNAAFRIQSTTLLRFLPGW